MKNTSFALLLILCLPFVSCTKSLIDPLKLQGKWKITASYISIGPPGKWTPTPTKKNYDYVQFNENGSLEGTLFTDYKTYLVKDSTTLTFFKIDKTIENYSYILKDGTLTLSPAGPVYCIEGCADRFVKVN